MRPVSTVRFLTDTSTSFENGSTEEADIPQQPPKTTTPTQPKAETQPTPHATPAQNIPTEPITKENLVTTNAQSDLLLGDQTLRVDGPVATIGSGPSKTEVNLVTNSAGQTVAIINGQSSALTQTAKDEIADFIATGLGTVGTGVPEQFMGQATHLQCRFSVVVLVVAWTSWWNRVRN